MATWAFAVTQHHFCHILLIEAVTMVHPGLRERIQTPPFSGEVSMSYYKKGMKDGKKIYIYMDLPSLKNTICHSENE